MGSHGHSSLTGWVIFITINVFIDDNEHNGPRATALIRAIEEDERFVFRGYRSLPLDVRFEASSAFNVELKEPKDYIASVTSGHLFEQILPLREAGEPIVILVIGSDEDVSEAIKDAVLHRRVCTHKTIAAYHNILRDFEACCFAERIPVLRWKQSAFSRLLSLAHKMLTGGNLMKHHPRPAEHERKIVALSMLVPGLGEKKARALLDRFGNIRGILEACDETKYQEVPGIGPKIAAALVEALKDV